MLLIYATRSVFDFIFLNAEEFWLNNKMNCPCLLCKKDGPYMVVS